MNLRSLYPYLLMFLFLGITQSCQNKDAEAPTTSFYYWKTNFSLSTVEREALQNNDINKLYVRYFDVALKDNKPFPISALLFKEKPPVKTLVPVVYIKNEVMLASTLDVKLLAQQMLHYIDQINTAHNIQIQEIQLDCDWTLKSRDAFFSLLRALKEERPLTYSCTIRLHQIKYPDKTGIPPVDYGVLMYYNMGEISSNSINSIYDRKIAQRYISSLTSYPLALNIALPIFSWAVHIRQGKTINLISRLTEEQLAAAPENFAPHQKGQYRVLQNGLFFGRLFAKDDILKIEEIKAEQLTEMATDLKKYMKVRPQEILYYDLDSTTINNYEKEIFKTIPTII